MRNIMIILGIMLLFLAVANAQVVYLWDGSQYSGEIVAQDNEAVYLKTGFMTVERISQENIKRISLLPKDLSSESPDKASKVDEEINIDDF